VRRTILIGVALLALGCGDGEAPLPDAGPVTGVFLTATGAAARSNINGVAPRMGFRYYLIDVTFEARGGGPISIAPFTFDVLLADGTRITADSRTNELEDGCTSRMVPVDGTVMCRLAFVAAEDAAPPASLEYDNDGIRATATVPALE